MMDWRDDYPAGSLVRLLRGHPFAGSRGEVVRHEEVGYFRAVGLVVAIEADDAMDGHECCVLDPHEIEIDVE